MTDDKDFNKILNNRFVEKPSQNLETLILSKTACSNVVPLSRVRDVLVFDMPAIASAACLIIGLTIGVLTNYDTTNEVGAVSDWFTFLSSEEESYL